jgi:hypothetical protein
MIAAFIGAALGAPFTFDNGVTIAHPHEAQVRRYRLGTVKLHEPEEERWFIALLFDATSGSVMLNVGAAAGYYALLALRYRPPIAVVALNPHPAFQREVRENAAAAGVTVVDLSCPDFLANATDAAPPRPRAGSIVQIGCAIDGERHKSYLGGGFGSGLSASKRVAFDAETRQAQKTLARSAHVAGRDAHVAAASEVAPVLSTRLCDVLSGMGLSTGGDHHGRPGRHAVFMATFDIQGRETAVFEAVETREMLRRHAIERFLIGTHGAAAHRVVLAALSEAHYTVLFNATAIAGQPDGLIVAISPRAAAANMGAALQL